MDMSKFKVSFEGLSFLKSYSSLLWPVIIVLAAVIFLVLSPLMGGKLEKRISKESISAGKQVKYLNEDVVSARQSDEEKKYQDAYENDANQIAALARQSSLRELLSYKIFPEPKETSSLIFDEYRDHFLDGIDELLFKVIAKDRPTDAELERAVSSSSTLSGRTRRSRGFNLFSGSRGMSSQLNEVDDMIVLELCRARAESASVYVNPADLSGYEFWKAFEYTGMDTAVEECWYWQLGYWIIEDVIDTIGATNSGSESVLTSAVKRLLSLSFVKSQRSFTSSRSRGRRSRRAPGTGGRGVDRPSYVLSDGDGLTEPCTGRFCSDEIDVVHFNLSVLIETKEIPLFMQQLCSSKEHKFKGFSGTEPEQTFAHNQITILEYDISPVDQSKKEHKPYVYGEDALVKLDLICEYIFDSKGYDEIKPEAIKGTPTSSG